MKLFNHIQLAGLFTLLSAATFLTGCSITDPSENFRVIVEGEIEKTIGDSIREYSATAVDTMLLQDYLFGATSVSTKNDQGGSQIDGADAPVVEIVATYHREYSIVAALESVLANDGTSHYSDIISGSFQNLADNPITLTVYIDRNSTPVGNVIGRGLRLMDIVVPANSNKTVVSDDDFSNLYLTQAIIDTIKSQFTFSSGRWYGGYGIFITANGDPRLDLRATVNFKAPSLLWISEQINADDLANYSLEEVDSIGLRGRFINNGAASIVFKSGFSNNANTLNSDDIYCEFTTTANDTTDFSKDTYFTQNGGTVMKTWFGKLFPPESRSIWVIFYIKSRSSMNIRFEDFTVVAYARIAEN